MIKICTRADLEKIQPKLSVEMYLYLSQQLLELITHLSSDTEMKGTSLANHGYRIILLEPSDSLEFLKNQFNFNVLGTALLHPEYIEVNALSNGTQTYRIAIMEDNHSMTLLYSIVANLHPSVEEWIIEISEALV